MNKAYSRINWQNQPSTSTALGATNLNKMDIALNSIDDRVITLDTTKLDLTTANSMVKSFSLDQSTGVITITLLDGTVTTYDTKLEKLAVNFAYDATAQQLVITLDDGTKQYVDMSALITQYEFKDSSTVGFTVDASGKVSASVKNGSITAEQLQPNYLADITTQQQTATAQAKLAKRYAVGGVETGDTTDNAKYYKEQAELFKTQAKQYRDEAQDISGVGIAGESKLGLVKGDGNVGIESDGDMWADPYKDKGTVTGTFINFKNSDDALAQINAKGITTATPTNPDLPISPDNKLNLSSPLNFDLVSSNENYMPRPPFDTWSVYGVSAKVNSDGSITLNGTATGNADFRIFGAYGANPTSVMVLPKDKYMIKGTKKEGVAYHIGYLQTTFLSVGDGSTPINLASDKDISYILLRVNKGIVVDNLTVYPQIVKGEVDVPYIQRKEHRINIPYPMRSLPNGVCDTLEVINGISYHVQRIKEHVLQAIDISSISTANTNNSYVFVPFDKLIGIKDPLVSDTIATKMLSTVTSPRNGATFDSVNNVYKHWFSVSAACFSFPKDKYVTLDDAKIAFTGTILTYELAEPIYTPLNTYLKTFKGVTNIFTNATPQPEITATFKPQLWADSYLKDKAIESKIDDKKRVNNLLSTDPTTVLSGAMGKLLQENIDAVNKNMPKQINYWGDTQLNLLKKINDVSDTTFRTVVINGWDSVFTDNDMPYRNTAWHVALYNNGQDVSIWQRWTNLDNGQVYIRLYKPSSNSWGGDWISNDLKQTADLLPEADILAAHSSVYPSKVSRIGNVVTLSFLFKKRDGSNFTVGQNVLLAKIPSGYTTTTNLCTSGLGSMTEDLSSPDTTKPQSIVFWNNGIFAHIAHETKVIGGSITYFI